MRNRWWAVPGLAAAALLLAGCGLGGGSPSSSAPPASHPAAAASSPVPAVATGAGAIKELTTTKGMVLTNASGMTLYWFAKDTSTHSMCLLTCKATWPPVIMTATAAAGTKLPGSFGTIKRPNGQIQLTYEGHPLYTYAGDTAVGMISGNGINAQGGLWWAMTPAGTQLGAAGAAGASASTGTSSSGGGASWG